MISVSDWDESLGVSLDSGTRCTGHIDLVILPSEDWGSKRSVDACGTAARGISSHDMSSDEIRMIFNMIADSTTISSMNIVCCIAGQVDVVGEDVVMRSPFVPEFVELC